ncbi:hypothetical protein NDI47_18020 [Microcoleus vaginatus GB1-A2]|uniref:hypothetical protein n=1 Tax=Microcoleus vaginatus TaxID=119532 RepID=UPI0032AE52F1
MPRFHRRGDAEGYLQILRRLLPPAQRAIVFDTSGAAKLGDARTSEIERMVS